MVEGVQVATGYRFCPVADPAALRDRIEAAAGRIGVLGTVLIASEGINLSIAGTARQIDAVEAMLAGVLTPSQVQLQRSPAGEVRPFRRLRVRLREEIVALGRGDAPLHFDDAIEASAEQWNRLLEDPAVPVIDVRNHYEVAVGRFEGAVDPHTDSFRQFPAWVEAHLDPQLTPEVAIYCTGGIRCTKAAAWMRGQGFKRVHELRGGILAYLAETSPERSRWQGECFVFDDRVGLGNGLEPGDLSLCPDCGQPHGADAAAPVDESSPQSTGISRHCRSRA
ncbi:MAG: hypothetical protein JJT88_12095 [Gammaproteobacteria bacterium]|nr:hypothetical protein [Gammaproteobacteria bacterium]